MNILVLCTGNSARSILLECILNRRGNGRLTCYSAGSKPTGRPHPGALALLTAKGYDTAHIRSKSWDEFASHEAPQMDLVITVCANAAGETCPVWPGAPLRAHWGVDDPAALPEANWADGFARAYDTLDRRAAAFLDLDPTNRTADALSADLSRIGDIP